MYAKEVKKKTWDEKILNKQKLFFGEKNEKRKIGICWGGELGGLWKKYIHLCNYKTIKELAIKIDLKFKTKS